MRPEQIVISKSRILEIVNSYDPIKVSSSVFEGHHTTVATAILGKGSGLNMNTPTSQLPSAQNVYWSKKWYEFWKSL